MQRKRLILLFLSLLVTTAIPVWGQQKVDEQAQALGKELFFSKTNSEKESCVQCHNVEHIQSDTLLVDPSAHDLALYSTSLSDEEFLKSINSPKGKLIESVHTGFSITKDEAKNIKAYLIGLKATPMEITTSFPTKAIFIVVLTLLLFLFIYLKMSKKKSGLSMVYTLLIIVCLVLISRVTFIDATDLGRQQGYAPDQPIKFSHIVHAKQNKIDCKYCHSGATQSKHASIPPAGLCLNCHKHVLEGSKTGKFEINKIHHAVNNNLPIKWVKVHNLPDHAFFSHAQHVKVGGLDCEKCHGDVEKMDVLSQQEDLSMSWCLRCHDDTKVDFSNPYYKKTYKHLYDDMLSGKRDSVVVSDIGGRDCSKCHY